MNAPVIQGGTNIRAGAKARNSIKPTGQIPPNVMSAGTAGVATTTDEGRNLIEEKHRQNKGYLGL